MLCSTLIETELTGSVILFEEHLIVRKEKAVITQFRGNLHLHTVSRFRIHISATLMTDLRRQLFDCFMERRSQVKAVLSDNHCTAAVELVALDHRTKHHIGVLFKVFVDRQSVLSLPNVYPIGNIGHFGNRFAFMFFQEDNIRSDFRACVILKRTILATRQTNSTDEVSLISQHLADTLITLIECACRGHECHDSAVFELVECFGKEEIVQFRGIVDGIHEAIISTPTVKSGNKPCSMNVK